MVAVLCGVYLCVAHTWWGVASCWIVSVYFICRQFRFTVSSIFYDFSSRRNCIKVQIVQSKQKKKKITRNRSKMKKKKTSQISLRTVHGNFMSTCLWILNIQHMHECAVITVSVNFIFLNLLVFFFSFCSFKVSSKTRSKMWGKA